MPAEIIVTYLRGENPVYEKWELQDMHCPECGKHTVWLHKDGGDYERGEIHRCASCKSYFTIQFTGGDIAAAEEARTTLMTLSVLL